MAEYMPLKKDDVVKKKIQKKKEQTADTPAPVNVENANVMDLQRMLGNRGAQQVLAQRKADSAAPPLFIQTKMSVGAADDTYEMEADRVANQVVNTPSAEGVQRQGEEEEMQMKRMDIQRQGEEEEMQMKRMDIQRQGEEEEMQMKRMDIQRQSEEEEMQMKRMDIQRQDMEEEEMQMKRMDIQRKGMEDAFDVGGDVESSIQSKRGSGQSLDGGTQNFMESRFGYDFSNVNVHTDADSDTLNRSLNARAFTTGSDVFFRSGEYNPNTSGGKELLAHELTHVVQQGGANALQKKDKDCDNC